MLFELNELSIVGDNEDLGEDKKEDGFRVFSEGTHQRIFFDDCWKPSKNFFIFFKFIVTNIKQNFEFEFLYLDIGFKIISIDSTEETCGKRFIINGK